MVTIKSEREIELMREAGKILAKVHEELGKAVKPGISTKEIDRICEEMIRSYGCIPSFLGYEGYPASVCISINDEVVHGIPSKHRYLNEGDIVSLDTGVIWKGYQSDAARTHMIGEVTPQARKLVEVTQQSFSLVSEPQNIHLRCVPAFEWKLYHAGQLRIRFFCDKIIPCCFV